MAIEVTDQMIAEIRAALLPLVSRRLRSWDRFTATAAAIEAGREADHQRRLAAWERNRPRREAGERAYQLAHARRQAELGARSGQRPPVLAAGWAVEPERPRVW